MDIATVALNLLWIPTKGQSFLDLIQFHLYLMSCMVFILPLAWFTPLFGILLNFLAASTIVDCIFIYLWMINLVYFIDFSPFQYVLASFLQMGLFVLFMQSCVLGC